MQDKTSINKYISDTGFCSRREADKYIEVGRVHVNGKVAQKGNRVSYEDEVTVDFQAIIKKKKKIISSIMSIIQSVYFQ